MPTAYPRYPPLLSLATLRSGLAVLAGRSCSLRVDALHMVPALRPPLHVHGVSPAIDRPRLLIAVNHYHRPGFNAWWIPLTICAQFPIEIHWGMTAAGRYPDKLRSATVTPLTQWLFRRLAKSYGLTAMPPMPSQSGQEALRARAVRHILAQAKAGGRTVIGLAPEGADNPAGSLRRPPRGIGRFVALLANEGLQLQPAGLYEAEGYLNLCFGEPMVIPQIEGPAIQRDRETADFVMRAIALCLPGWLRGDYA